MDRTTFEDRLRDAAICSAREYILQTCPDAFVVRVAPNYNYNYNYNGNPRVGDEEVDLGGRERYRCSVPVLRSIHRNRTVAVSVHLWTELIFCVG